MDPHGPPRLPPSFVRVGGYNLAYVERGEGAPVLLVHGSLSDYRYWTLQMKMLGAEYRTLAVSLRHYYPEPWDGSGDDFSVAQHVRDLAGFIDALSLGPVHVVGHSRGGRVAFDLARLYPDKVRKLVLAEPGGMVDATLSAEASEINARLDPGGFQSRAFAAIQAGRLDDGLALFIDAVAGAGAWTHLPETAKQFTRDNAATLTGQVKETHEPLTRAMVEAVKAPTLLVHGALSPPPFGQIVEALAAAMPLAERLTIDNASHAMNVVQADVFNRAVLRFLQKTG